MIATVSHGRQNYDNPTPLLPCCSSDASAYDPDPDPDDSRSARYPFPSNSDIEALEKARLVTLACERIACFI